MANRTQRTAHAEVLLAQRHRAEHDDITRRLGEAEGKLQRLDAAVQDREAQLDAATSEWLKGIVREELAELNREREDVRGQVSGFRQELQRFDRRLGTVESRVSALRGDVDGLQAHSEAHASAISQIQAANGWIPPAAAAVAGFITYLFIEWVVDAWRVGQVSTHIQWAWTLAVASVVGLIASLITGEGRINSTSTATAATGAGTTPALPPADQPVTTQLVVTPAPADQSVTLPPPPTGRFPTVQAAAAASASGN